MFQGLPPSEGHTNVWGIFYTRVREDREGLKGSTPTKLKIPLIKAFLLPQLDPTTDIPYTWAIRISQMFQGKPVYYHHSYEKVYGIIRTCDVTTNPKYVPKPSNKRNAKWEGKKLQFSSLAGEMGLINEEIPTLLEENRVMNLEGFDLSIGYSFHWDIDDEDIKWITDEDGNEWLDWDETLCYATGFKPDEISLCDNGKAACPGATIMTQLSKTQGASDSLAKAIGVSAKLLDVLKLGQKKLGELSGDNQKRADEHMSNISSFLQGLSKNCHPKFHFFIAQDTVKKLQSIAHWTDRFTKKKGMDSSTTEDTPTEGAALETPPAGETLSDENTMDTSDDAVPETETQVLDNTEPPAPEPDQSQKEGQPNPGMTRLGPPTLSSDGDINKLPSDNPMFSSFDAFMISANLSTKELADLGKRELEKGFDRMKKYHEEKNEKFPIACAEFMKRLKKSDPLISESQLASIEEQFKKIYTNPKYDAFIYGFEKMSHEYTKNCSIIEDLKKNQAKKRDAEPSAVETNSAPNELNSSMTPPTGRVKETPQFLGTNIVRLTKTQPEDGTRKLGAKDELVQQMQHKRMLSKQKLQAMTDFGGKNAASYNLISQVRAYRAIDPKSKKKFKLSDLNEKVYPNM